MKDAHGSFPYILALDTENGCHGQMCQQEEQDSEAGYPVQYVQVTF